MRSIELKLSLNKTQQAKVEDWLSIMRWVWNQGLKLLEDFTAFSAWDKLEKQWVPCCPVSWDYYKADDGQLVPFTRLAKVKPYRMSCPIPQPHHTPELESPTFYNLVAYFAQKNHSDKPWFCEVPNKFVTGLLRLLVDAWEQYRSGKRKRPHYKRYRDKVKVLVNSNAKSIRVKGKKISLPKLGRVTVKNLDKHWVESISISVLKIKKEPSGYYLHLTGELPTKQFKPSCKAVGLATGYRNLYTSDSGKSVEPPAYYRKLEKRLARLQRRANRRQPGSANQQKALRRFGKLHEKIRRSRRASNHKLSSYLVREYGGIAINQSKIKQITRRPKPVVNRQGTGYAPNGAIRKSQVNKQFLDHGLGQLTKMCKAKAKAHGREFVEVNIQKLSDELNTQVEKFDEMLRLPRSIYLTSFCGRYRAWAWEQTPGESALQRTVNQEVLQKSPHCDAVTTSTNDPTTPATFHGLSNALEIPGSQEYTNSYCFENFTSDEPNLIGTTTKSQAKFVV